MVVHLSASTIQAPDPDAKVLVAAVEDALRLGADAVSTHVNVGSLTEAQQLCDLSRVARDCAHWQVPLLAMTYPRGPNVRNPSDPDLIAHCATLAAELGADMVKVPYTGSVATMRQVVESCPIPLLVAGGPRVPSLEDLARFAREVVESDAAGVAMGRNVFAAADPGEAARRVAVALHGTESRLPAHAAGGMSAR
jgi:2-amino-4,5-dihydroxy-6-oxo-7-(phosphonooxy)heptanoate synthase